jgi:hypothetical protein
MNRAEWQLRYDGSASIRALARDMGVSHSWVASELKRVGIESRIKRASHPKALPTDAERAEWQRLLEEAGSVSELARRKERTPGAITYHLKRHGITGLSSGFKSPKSVSHFGSDHASWKGGTYYHSDGYVYEYAPNHPDAASAKGYVLQHRLVMERKLGRPLAPGELVHHVNEVKDDNRPENLELHDRSTHMKHHKRGAARDVRGRYVE